MADSEQNRAEQHRLALTEISVRQPAAEHRCNIYQRGIGTIDEVRVPIGIKPVLDEIERQQRAHAVIGKTLPHFGEEKDVEALGMAGEFLLRLGDGIGPQHKEEDQSDRAARSDPIAFIP